jgi:hypothetical protein
MIVYQQRDLTAISSGIWEKSCDLIGDEAVEDFRAF